MKTNTANGKIKPPFRVAWALASRTIVGRCDDDRAIQTQLRCSHITRVKIAGEGDYWSLSFELEPKSCLSGMGKRRRLHEI